MRAVRQRLRLLATTWLVLQAASLSAIVPRDCCAAHKVVAATMDRDCHQSAAAQAERQTHHHSSAPAEDDTCALRGACDGPMAAFIAQLSLQGVFGQPPQLAPRLVVESFHAATREHLTSRLVPPDSPPPRA